MTPQGVKIDLPDAQYKEGILGSWIALHKGAKTAQVALEWGNNMITGAGIALSSQVLENHPFKPSFI